MTPTDMTELQPPVPAPGPRRKLMTVARRRSRMTSDAYLLVHALASAAAPHTAVLHAGAWARLLGLGDTATPNSEKSAVSKVMRRLEQRQLVTRSRRNRATVVTLLREDGSGEEFVRAEGHTRSDRWLQHRPGAGAARHGDAVDRPEPAGRVPHPGAAGRQMVRRLALDHRRRTARAGLSRDPHRDWQWIKAPGPRPAGQHSFTLLGDDATDSRKTAAKSRYGDPDTAEDADVSNDVEAVLDELAGENQ